MAQLALRLLALPARSRLSLGLRVEDRGSAACAVALLLPRQASHAD